MAECISSVGRQIRCAKSRWHSGWKRILVSFGDKVFVSSGAGKMRTGALSPVVQTVVLFESLMLRRGPTAILQVIFSWTTIPVRDERQRRVLTMIVLGYLVQLRGGTCCWDPLMRSCQKRHTDEKYQPPDLEFCHWSGAEVLYHSREYK